MERNLDISSPIEKYVRKKLVSIDANESVVSAANTMRQNGIGSLVVVQGNDPVGILTERDILYKVVASKKDPSRRKLGQ